ncbi:helix-turn-helix domain-containing protein [Methylobacterium sp. JK268]
MAAPLHQGPAAMANNLKELRRKRGWTMEVAADAMGLSTKGYEKIERGERRLTADRIARAAEIFQVSAIEIIGDRNPIKIIGEIKKGGIVKRFSGSRELFEDAPRPEDASQGTVALIVTEDGAMPAVAEENWLVYHDEEHAEVPEEWIGSLCVVSGRDGMMRIGRVFHGGRPGTYDLFTVGHDIVRGIDVEWAAKVTWLKPR